MSETAEAAADRCVWVKVIVHARDTGRVLLCLLPGYDGQPAYWSTFGCELDSRRSLPEALEVGVHLSLSRQAGWTAPVHLAFIGTTEDNMFQGAYFTAQIDSEFEHQGCAGVLNTRWFTLDEIDEGPISSGLFSVLTLPHVRSHIFGDVGPDELHKVAVH